MKLRILLLPIVFIIGTTTTLAQSAQSDCEIQKAFKTQYAEFEDQIERTSSPDSIQQVIASIKQFDEQYKSHSDLLNKALYPDTYQQRMEELKKSSVITKNRLQTIEQQTQKMDELQTQLTTYQRDMRALNKRTDSLKVAIQKSTQSEKQLADMLREYRNNLENHWPKKWTKISPSGILSYEHKHLLRLRIRFQKITFRYKVLSPLMSFTAH